MSRLLIRSGKDPFTPVDAESTLTQDVFNTNVGNYLFAHSIHKTLMTPGNELVSNSTLSENRMATARAISRVNEQFDGFVVPLANAFRPQFSKRLERLTSLIRGLDIPVVVVGVGAQTDLSLDTDQMSEVNPIVRAFVAAVLDRSASIGVRGEFTAGYLRGLGFPDSSIDIIGCPSLFLHGPDFRLTPAVGELSSDARIALNITKGVPGLGDLCMNLVRRHPNLVYVGQDRDDLHLMVWGEEIGDPADSGLPVHLTHPLYQRDQVRLPLDMWTWLDFMKTFDFTVGTRFHGNVAAVLANRPATMLVHDSRTLELAAYHQLPHRLMTDTTSDITTGELYETYDPAAFNDAYASGFDSYLAFLERNKLSHIYEPGNANPEFDRRLSEVTFPPLVTPLHSPEVDQVAARLRWLRDGQAFDSSIHLQAYRHPYPFPPPKERSTPQRDAQSANETEVARLGQRLAVTTRKLERSQARLKAQHERLVRQQERLQRQRERLQNQTERLNHLEKRVTQHEERSLVRRLRRLLARLRP